MRMTCAQREQLAAQLLVAWLGFLLIAFDAQRRLLNSIASHADQGCTMHCWMSVKDALAGNGEEGDARRDDALRFAVAKPETAGRIQVSNIAHTMIETTVDGISDLG